jgi:hypothetical protein
MFSAQTSISYRFQIQSLALKVIFIKIYNYIRPQLVNLKQQQQQQKKGRQRDMTSSKSKHVPRFIKLAHTGYFASSSFS